VRFGGRDEKVRFIGVDTPESTGTAARASARECRPRWFTRHRLSGRTVRLDFDVRLRDVYGRLLAYVYNGPELFNLTLLRRGFAANDPVPRTRGWSPVRRRGSHRSCCGLGRWSAC